MKKNLYYLLYIGVLMMFLAGCQDEGMFMPEENDAPVSLSYTVRVGEDAESRAIGDGSKVDELIVGVFQDGTQIKQYTYEVKVGQKNVINIPLLRNETYDLVFWAQKSGNAIYETEDLSDIGIDYSQYAAISLVETEDFEAFSLVLKEVSVDQPGDADLVLYRPFAQLNIAASEADMVNSEIGVRFTIDQVYTSYNPLSDKGDEVVQQEFSFSFSESDIKTMQYITIGGTTYYYLASAYLLAPESVALEGGIYNGEELVKSLNIETLPLAANTRTNIYGDMIQQEEMQGWDGIACSESLTTEGEYYIIDEEADLAWLSKAENTSSLSPNSKFLVKKNVLNMGGHSISSIQLPSGSIFNGNEKAIKNFANSLFGNAMNLTVQNLTLDNVVATAEEGHVGVLVNTLTGSSTFTGVTITNSSATTANGAAGGMVGYIVRTSEKNRTETLDVSFSGCKLNGVSVSGSASEGKFVGLLSGYDNNESLTFDASCEATNVSVADYTSVYIKANNSAWVTGDVTNKYDGWLGHETYRRAKVTFGGVRLAPRWDGKTATAKADLLLNNGESNKYEVHSPFDLAGVRNATASPAALYLMENVDMYGQGADGKFFVHSNFTQSAYNSTDDNNFTAFSSIALLEGNDNGIYNLALNSKGSDRYAFILSGDNGHIHRNTSFHNCYTVVPHIVGTDDGQTVDKSYGATVVLSVGGATYNMNNVHAYGCKVFALQKTGIIAGRSRATSLATFENCSVNDCYIENYDCKEHQEDFESLAKFYSPGEIGGFIGFVDNFATLKNCHVKGTTIYAFGQKDQKLMLVVTIPGRHVAQFIGDIRTSGKEKDIIKLENCTIDSNTKCTKTWDKHSKCNMIGKVYYLNALGIVNIDSKGTVTLDGKSIF